MAADYGLSDSTASAYVMIGPRGDCIIMTTKRSLSYEQLMATTVEGLQELVAAEMLDDATLGRVGHVRRFLSRVAEMVPGSASDDFTEQELQDVWKETAPEDARAAIGRCPLIG
jgi:hypothetical protein